MSVSTFGALGVPDDLCALLADAGINTPFPIQAAVIADAMAGRDVTGRAPTGSGKTLAFGIPVVTRMRRGRPKRPTALVLAPTRELAEQIATAILPLARARGHRVASVYGGVGYRAQLRALDAGASLVVACPGRLEDLLASRALSLENVDVVVVDEADRLADMGFLPAVQRILDQTAADRQVLMFSATLDGAVGTLAGSVQRDPVRHEVGPEGPDMSATRHAFWTVERTARTEWTAHVVRRLGSTIVFCRTRHGADRLSTQLARLGVSAATLHGGLTQSRRDQALKAFTTGQVATLVATDVAARGVHVDDVAAVVHFDPPADASTYIHRSGRTARAGASGVVVSLIERGAHRDARRMQREIGIDVPISAASLDELGSSPARPLAEPPREPVSERRTGTMMFFHEGRGYGFIDVGTEAGLFVHHSNITGSVSKGQRVEFGVRQGRIDLEAFDVIVAETPRPLPQEHLRAAARHGAPRRSTRTHASSPGRRRARAS
jgi:superfamily II DNA/RNA helicase